MARSSRHAREDRARRATDRRSMGHGARCSRRACERNRRVAGACCARHGRALVVPSCSHPPHVRRSHAGVRQLPSRLWARNRRRPRSCNRGKQESRSRYRIPCKAAAPLCSFTKWAAKRHAVAPAMTSVAVAADAKSPWSSVGRTPFPFASERPQITPDRGCSSAMPCGFRAKPQPPAACGSSGDRLGRTVLLGLRERAAVARASVSAPLSSLVSRGFRP